MTTLAVKKLKTLVKNLERKTFAIQSLGCRTNQAEAFQLASLLESWGLKPEKKSPGLLLVNTCAVTQKAVAESKKALREGRGGKVVAVGCGVAFDRTGFSFADLAFSNEEKETLLSLSSSCSFSLPYSFLRSKRFLLRIQSGCNHFCRYCIVPYLRRELISLSLKKAVEAVKEAEKSKFQEVILTGTNLALYRFNLATLLRRILLETKIARIGLGSVNVESFTPELIRLYQDNWQGGQGRLNRYLHVPLQSGSDVVLEKMNRPYRTREYSSLIFSLTKKIPLLAIGTDIVVGFPGETKKEFEKTVALVKRLPFARLHVFRYNPRRGTSGEKMEKAGEGIEKKEKEERAKLLREIGQKKKEDFFKKLKGRKMKVLFLKKEKDGWRGLTDNYQLAKLKSKENLRGKIKRITIA